MSDLKNEILTKGLFECFYKCTGTRIQHGVALCYGKVQVSVATAVLYIHHIYLYGFYLRKRPPLWSEFLATDPEVPGSIPGAIRLSEK
jgi:hypothetical protein